MSELDNGCLLEQAIDQLECIAAAPPAFSVMGCVESALSDLNRLANRKSFEGIRNASE